MSNTNRIVPRRIFRPVTVSNAAWNKLAKGLSAFNKDIPWRIFGLVTVIAIVGAILTCAFMAYVLPLHLRILSFQMFHWWPWKDPVLIDNTTIYVGVSVLSLGLYLGWRFYRYLSSQMPH
ncbi:hypothetical protein HYT05_04580 [Candidatus Kaiserbacteria bacterium]|nr:hypothetical protein [Candidatus Kaiserbacteria bacterium]